MGSGHRWRRLLRGLQLALAVLLAPACDEAPSPPPRVPEGSALRAMTVRVVSSSEAQRWGADALVRAGLREAGFRLRSPYERCDMVAEVSVHEGLRAWGACSPSSAPARSASCSRATAGAR